MCFREISDVRFSAWSCQKKIISFSQRNVVSTHALFDATSRADNYSISIIVLLCIFYQCRKDLNRNDIIRGRRRTNSKYKSLTHWKEEYMRHHIQSKSNTFLLKTEHCSIYNKKKKTNLLTLYVCISALGFWKKERNKVNRERYFVTLRKK